MTSWDKLPCELATEILSNLPGPEIGRLALVSKQFYQASLSNTIWSRRAYIEYGVDLPKCEGRAREFYQKVLHKYGRMLGLWQAEADCFGGLMQVKVDGWRVHAEDLLPPKNPHLTRPLRCRPLFSVVLDPNGIIQTLCNVDSESAHVPSSHSCEISLQTTVSNTPAVEMLTLKPSPSLSLVRRCAKSECHESYEDETILLTNWLHEETDHSPEMIDHGHECLMYKYLVMKHYKLKTLYKRLEWPLHPTQKVPVAPGLFKGTYSAHGLELIMLSYNTSESQLNCVKITGDQNVPAGQITLRADLPYCMRLESEEQSDFETVKALEPRMNQHFWWELGEEQPFVLPRGVTELSLGEGGFPSKCRARFYGFGQIAHHGFTRNCFTPGHLIVFDENTFAFLWMELQCISVYHRMQESLFRSPFSE